MNDKDPQFFFPRQSGLRREDFKEPPWFELDAPTAVCLGLLAGLLWSLL
jgi:hypothetical protein